MADRVKTLIITAVILLVILGLVLGAIFLIGRIVQNRKVVTDQTKSIAPIVRLSPRASFEVQPTLKPQSDNTKTYKEDGFSITYPKNWGLLTCKNSRNLELDPLNSSDQLGVVCDRAVKPITVMVGFSTCQGEAVEKGGVLVVFSKTTTANGVKYRWCTKTSPSLEITHRVSTSLSRATSKKDFSAEIDKIISSLQFSSNSPQSLLLFR